MKIDLNIGLSKKDVDLLEWSDIEEVNHTANTVHELVQQLDNMPLELPSEAFNEYGYYLWDYKDHNRFIFNTYYAILESIEGVVITDSWDGPKRCFIEFTFKGETSGIGPGYKSYISKALS